MFAAVSRNLFQKSRALAQLHCQPSKPCQILRSLGLLRNVHGSPASAVPRYCCSFCSWYFCKQGLNSRPASEAQSRIGAGGAGRPRLRAARTANEHKGAAGETARRRAATVGPYGARISEQVVIGFVDIGEIGIRVDGAVRPDSPRDIWH